MYREDSVEDWNDIALLTYIEENGILTLEEIRRKQLSRQQMIKIILVNESDKK